MTLRVAFRQAAKVELEDAVLYYERQRAGVGEELVREIDVIVARAAAHPDRFPTVFGDVRRAVARRFPFSVYFRVRSPSLVVLAVFHSRRDPMIWQRRN